MNIQLSLAITLTSLSLLVGCSNKTINLSKEEVHLVNRQIVQSPTQSSKVLMLNNQMGDGLAILKNTRFDEGIIEIELKGENLPGRSFIGLAFNIQNDSTYEAIYFRPFNFQADEQIKREHSVQYISHPKNTWRYLRTNFEGQYEAEYTRKPSPDEWFSISISIDSENVTVYDEESNTELLRVVRLEKQMSDRIGLWTGNNSKGEFRKLMVHQ